MSQEDAVSNHDPVEAARLRALGVIDHRTMIPAGLVPPPDDHPFWPELVRRLDGREPLDEATWAMVEKAMHPAHPAWDDVAPHLLERAGWAAKHAEWAAQAAVVRPGRIQHGGAG